jgi:3-dehydroquinate synthase
MTQRQTVIITTDIQTELQAFLEISDYDKLFILTDTNTCTKCYPAIQAIPHVQKGKVIAVKAGDSHKNLEQVTAIWNFLSNSGASRNSLLINLGGGMITDMGGFAGATFKRGMKTINIPTTLMAAVDAAVGGKTGVNFNGLKNEIGSFYPPERIFIDCNFLNTLDKNNVLSGYAEMIKHALISSEKIYRETVRFNPDEELSAGNRQLLSALIQDSVAIKERIVEEDPTEKGIRKALNLGHTIGHAIESLSFQKNAPLLHGHAVAAGLICELYLSCKLCRFPSEKLARTTHYIKEYYPVFFFDCKDYDALYERMTHDKKNEGGIINFTLLSDIGQVCINQETTKELIFESLDFYRESFGI